MCPFFLNLARFLGEQVESKKELLGKLYSRSIGKIQKVCILNQKRVEFHQIVGKKGYFENYTRFSHGNLMHRHIPLEVTSEATSGFQRVGLAVGARGKGNG